MADDLLDQREAMSILGMNENDLLQVVARGDLRAFRSTGTLRFRRDDVLALKNEKGTEPTIIIPAAAPGSGTQRSGILPTVGAPPTRPPSRVMKAAQMPAPVQDNATSDIVLDDIELTPVGMDDGSITQQNTVAQSAVGTSLGATIMEPAGHETGTMTQIDGGVQASTGPAQPVITGSGARTSVGTAAAAPAMSRVRAAVSTPGVSMATSKRTQAVFQAKGAGAGWTVVMILNSIVFMLAASIFAVMISKGSYDKESKQRIIPPFLSQTSPFKVYFWTYDNTPGVPQDKDRPKTEYAPGGAAQ